MVFFLVNEDITDMAAKANILLVDDRPDNLLALEAVLDDLGQNLVRASSGEEALRRVQDETFAVVLLDVRLGTMDGFQVAQAMRAMERSRHTPIIFITAEDNDELSPAKAYTLGAVDYLVKPLEPTILRAKVEVFVRLFQHAHLQQSERRLRALLENAWDGISLVAADGTIRENFADNLHRLGYTSDEFIGHSCFEFFHPEEVPVIRSALEQLVRVPGAKTSIQFRMRRKDGSWRWMEGTGTNLLHEPSVQGIIVNYQDITEQREIEGIRAQLAAIVESSEDAIIGLDLHGLITSWNQGAERLYGYSADEVLGQPLACLVPPEQPDEFPDLLERILREERIAYYRTVRQRKDGSRVDVALSVSPIRDGTGQIVGAAKIVHDIGPQIRMEQELRRRAEELVEADRQKDQFLAMLAHELRNPLAPLLTGLQILRLPHTPPERSERTREMMERQLRQMTHLVDDLLDMSRILRGKVQLRRERLDLGKVARTAAEDRRVVLERAGLSLHLDFPQTPVWVRGDETRLSQILNNLLDNAVKFHDSGRHVWVRVAKDAERKEAVLTVRDDGIGIDPAMLPRLFNVFTQVDRSLDRTRGGLGLGLSLVKGLAELHGGSVEAQSAGPGQGAEFTVRLPLEGEPAILTGKQSSVEAGARRQRILVIEDNRDAGHSLQIFLQMLGHEVRLAYTGPEGVTAAQAWRPDIVLCDIGLPGLDGFGVARELRLNPTTARVRLLALTGYGQEEDRRRSHEAGFDHHLVKPADPEELLRLLASG
jgi:PAS domain S-box-containing protein